MRPVPRVAPFVWLALVGHVLPGPAILSQEPTPGSPEKNVRADDPVDPTIAELLAAHNRYRDSEKKPPLKWEPRLSEAARAHARDMAGHNKLAHEGGDGSLPKDRVRRFGYVYQEVGENVASGQATVAAVMRSWIESEPHRENLLGDFTEMGAAVARGSDGENYWCVDFGRPMPLVDPKTSPGELIEALNQARSAEHRKKLRLDTRLAAVADRFAREAAERRTLQLKDREGKTPFQILEAQGYRSRRFGTTISSGEGDPQKVVARWLGDARERGALLSNFERVGVGVATDPDGIPYWIILLTQGAGR